MLVDVADLDCVYLSYDEPKREQFWVEIQNLVPWAVRVDGVEGSDAAHKAAADASTTDRFILIDGDNIPYAEFFDLTLDIKPELEDCVFRWKAVNEINGLMYGNGGLSCWTKDFVYNMRTHEASDGSDDTAVEFCYDDKYIAMNNVYSTTYPNGSERHAFRAGFREGVKMCLRKGTRPSLTDFEQMVHERNFDSLSIWHNIGTDVEHGQFSIWGARLGTYMTMFTEWDYTQVQQFSKIDAIYEDFKRTGNIESINNTLRQRLDLQIVDYTEQQSRFFKHYYKHTYFPADPMTTEMEVVRRLEGW